MIKKKYFKKIAVVAATAALLFQVQPAIAADIFEDGETTAATEEIQEPEAVPMAAAEEMQKQLLKNQELKELQIRKQKYRQRMQKLRNFSLRLRNIKQIFSLRIQR